MANELTFQIAMNRQNQTSGLSNDRHTLQPVRYTVDQTTAAHAETPYTLTTTETSFVVTDGFVYIQNNDATNFIEWGFSTGVLPGKVRPKHTAGPFEVDASTTIYWKAAASSIKANVINYRA